MGSIMKMQGKRGVSYRARVRMDGRVAVRTFRRKHDADAWVAQMEVDKDRGVAMDPALGRTTFGRLAELWLSSNPGKREATVARDLSVLNVHVLPAIGHWRIESIKPPDVQELVNGWTARMSPNSVARVFATLRAVLGYGVRFEMLGRSPCRNIHLPKGTVREPHSATQEQLAALYGAMDPRFALMVWTAALTGMRWGEVAGLRVGELDFAERVVRVKEINTRTRTGATAVGPPKSKASVRTIAIPDALVDALSAHLVARGMAFAHPRALAFPAPGGGLLGYNNFRTRIWLPAATAAGLAGFGFHDLRRTNATLLIHAGVDVKTAQTRLGHSDPRLTIGLYAQAVASSDRAAADALARLTGPTLGRPRAKRAREVRGVRLRPA